MVVVSCDVVDDEGFTELPLNVVHELGVTNVDSLCIIELRCSVNEGGIPWSVTLFNALVFNIGSKYIEV